MPDQDREFEDWLRRTIRRFQQHEMTGRKDELVRPRYDDPGVQRRIADLIGKIADKPPRRRKQQQQ